MPRIAFTIPIAPGGRSECIRLLQKYGKELDEAHEAVGATQWVKFVDRDEYVEFIDWKQGSFLDLLRAYLPLPELQEFLVEIGPYILTPPVPEGGDAAAITAAFLEGRTMNQAYAFKPPPG